MASSIGTLLNDARSPARPTRVLDISAALSCGRPKADAEIAVGAGRFERRLLAETHRGGAVLRPVENRLALGAEHDADLVDRLLEVATGLYGLLGELDDLWTVANALATEIAIPLAHALILLLVPSMLVTACAMPEVSDRNLTSRSVVVATVHPLARRRAARAAPRASSRMYCTNAPYSRRR